MLSYIPSELIKVKKLVDEGKHDEALHLIREYEKDRAKSILEILSSKLFESDILFQQGLYEKAYEKVEFVFNRSKKEGEIEINIDAVIKSINLMFYLGKREEISERIKEAENLLTTIKFSSENNYQDRKALLAFHKARFYASTFDLEDFETSLKLIKKSLTIFEEIGNIEGIIHALSVYGEFLAFGKGELDQGISYITEALSLAEKNKKEFLIGYCFRRLVSILSYKGLFDQSLIYAKRSLEIFEKFRNEPEASRMLSDIAIIYKKKGDFNFALDYLRRALKIQDKLTSPIFKVIILGSLVEVTLAMGDIESAKGYLVLIEEVNEKVKVPFCDIVFRDKKAQILAASPRAAHRVEAEKIYKKIIEDLGSEDVNGANYYLELCDLLIFELEVTNDMEIFEEINTYVSKVLRMAEKSNSFWLMGETIILQAKLALYKLDFNKARHLLTKGQQIADRHNMELLALKISNEHDELFKNLTLWESFKNSEAPFTKRFKLSRIKDQMNDMLNKSKFEPLELEAEQPILLIIITEFGAPLLFNHFTADLVIDDASLGEFLSSCNLYCDKIFSETFDRVKFGQYTVLINSVDGLFICYLFQGQTYSAQQKIKHFSETFNRNTELKEKFKTAQNEGRIIHVENNPSIGDLIIGSFMPDPNKFRMPFKAYKGDQHYVFASYAHADKLEVYPIIDYLNKEGVKIWYDEGIPLSENWKKSIAVNLERCHTFLVFISPHIIDSEYVRKEISFALKKKKPFFAIYLKETKLPTELEFEIADIQAMMKFLMPKHEFYSKLSKELTKALNY